jgi:YD repeat-containing protein
MSDASFYSQSSNFISAVQGGVDPRTGLYTFTLPLAKLQGNGLAGPALALTLNYSPLSAVDIGFGTGVGLNLSTYDTGNFQLSLSTGEKYYTDADGTIRQRKLNNVNLTQQDDGWLLTHKSGLTEHLSLSHDTLFVTDTLTAPDGRALHIAWNDDLSSPGPVAVTDDAGTTLLSVTYGDGRSSTTVTVWPGTPAEYTWTLGFENAFLTSLTNDGSDPAMVWTLGYDTIGTTSPLNAMVSCLSPTGLKASAAYYTDEADWMQFPDAAPASLSPLPCVQYLTVSPGNGQPDMVTQYSYTQKNYLGKDGNFNNWQPDSDCMLGYLEVDYLYGSTAEQLDTDGQTALVTTTRRYNGYHLLISEETSQGSSNDLRTHLKETAYFAVPGDSFDAQPAQYQCPQTVTETWTDASKPDGQQSRREVSAYAFDESGNPTSHTAPDGTVTTMEYYPAEGDGDSCPADPYGFVRYVKTKTVTPPDKQGDELTQQTVSTWLKLDTAQGYAVLPAGVVHTCGKVSLSITKQYFTDGGNMTQFGRLMQKQTVRIPDTGKGDSWASTEAHQYTLDGENLVQTSTLTGFDSISATIQKAHDIRTGKITHQVDALQNTGDYARDPLERIVSRTLNKGSAYENTFRYTYSLADNSASATDPSGNTTTQYHDGLGRPLRVTVTPSGLGEMEISRSDYNVLGQHLRTTETDPRGTGAAGAGDAPSTITATLTWDHWGQNTRVDLSDSTSCLNRLDPVTLQKTQQETGGGASLTGGTATSGSRVTQYDAQLKVPLSDTLLDASGTPLGSSQHAYDGMKRLRQTTDIMGNVTTYLYDEDGRVLKQTLPDGSCVEKTYAPHTAHPLVTAITVTPKGGSAIALGTQDFDSLGRVKTSISGGRTTAYRYEGCQPHPVTVTAPDGQAVSCTYIPQLGDHLATLSATGISQTFDYDATTGLLQQGSVDGGLTVKLAHNPMGQLISETRIAADTQQNQAAYSATVRNTPLSYTDVTGAKQTYGYDAYGRLTLCDDPDIRVEMTYDVLGRLHTQKTSSKNDDGAVTLTLAYDDFYRETRRALTNGDGALLMQLDSDWYASGQLKQETRSDATGVTGQTRYTYDGRSRLTDWSCSGTARPVDAYGQTLLRQQFTFDALNNLTQCVTTFGAPDHPESDTTTYIFGNPADPTQLTGITHTHQAYPQSITLKYDSNGRMVLDEAGRQLGYDTLGRLQSLSGGTTTPGGSYSYDAFDVLCQQQVNDEAGTAYELYYRGHDLVCEKLPATKESRRFMRMNGQSLGMTTKAQQ